MSDETKTITLTVNGESVTKLVDARTHLVDFLRGELGLVHGLFSGGLCHGLFLRLFFCLLFLRFRSSHLCSSFCGSSFLSGSSLRSVWPCLALLGGGSGFDLGSNGLLVG